MNLQKASKVELREEIKSLRDELYKIRQSVPSSWEMKQMLIDQFVCNYDLPHEQQVRISTTDPHTIGFIRGVAWMNREYERLLFIRGCATDDKKKENFDPSRYKTERIIVRLRDYLCRLK